MSRYFDRDFFKLLLIFAVIIVFSLAVITVAKIYGSETKIESDRSLNVTIQ